MTDILELGCAPAGEDCVQVSAGGEYLDEMRRELRRFRQGLERYFARHLADGKIHFSVKWQPHDFGRYGEVCVCFDGGDREAVEAAFDIENNLPATWDDLEHGIHKAERT